MHSIFNSGKFLFLAAFSAACLLFSGCGEVAVGLEPVAAEAHLLRGQIFFVTSGGESVTLGSVRVQLFDPEVIGRHLEERVFENEERLDRLRGELERLESEAKRHLVEKTEAERGYAERLRQMRAEIADLDGEIEVREREIGRLLATNQEFIDFVSNFPKPPRGIPSPAEAEAYEVSRRKWLSMSRSERETWGTLLVGLNRELEEERGRLSVRREEVVGSFEPELEEVSEKIALADEAQRELAARIEGVRAEIEKPLDRADYLSGLPQGLGETRTDAAGEFQVETDPGRSYVLLARAVRRIDGEEFDLGWLIPVSAGERGRLLLSNHNLIGGESGVDFVDFVKKRPDRRS